MTESFSAVNSTVESTGVVSHLDMMVELLCSEEEERNPADPGTMVSTLTMLAVNAVHCSWKVKFQVKTFALQLILGSIFMCPNIH